MEQPKLRREYKHVMNYGDYYPLRGRLKAVMKSDGNTNDDGTYTVHSGANNLYFKP